MKVFITKYALSQGIYEAEVEDCGDGMVRQPNANCYASCFHGEGREWAKTREAAIECAEKMRTRKLASIEKQVKKLKALEF